MYEQQPLKMSSAEALCETEAPASFSIFAWNKLGSNECDDVHSITVPGPAVLPRAQRLLHRRPRRERAAGALLGGLRRDLPRRPVAVRRQGRRADRLPAGARRHLLELPADGRHGRGLGRRSPRTRCGPPAAAGCRRRGSASTGRCSPSARRSWPTRPAGSSPRWAGSRSSSSPIPTCPSAEQIWFFTAQAVSPGVSAGEVLTSLITLTVVYGALAVVEVGLIARFVRRGDHHRRRRADPDRHARRPRPRRRARGRRPLLRLLSSGRPDHGPADPLVRRRRGALDRLPPARGLRLRRRRAAAGARPPPRRPAPHAAQHRPAVGRQRGLADHRRRRGVRRLPRLVRHLAARAVPAVRDRAARADRAGGRLRVAALLARPAVGRDLDPRHHRRLAGRRARGRRRAGRDHARPADRRRRQPGRRQPSPGSAGRRCWARSRSSAFAARPRGAVPRAEDRRRRPAAGPGAGAALVAGRRAAAAGLGRAGAPARTARR